MANVSLWGATYSDVPAITVPQAGGGTVTFYENGGGGSITVTEEANATGITCVITTGSGGDDPTPAGDIPLNTQLIDYTQTTRGMELDSNGQAISADSWYYLSDYTAIDPSMTFSFTGTQWGVLAVYDSSKAFVRAFDINDIKDSASNSIAYGTLSGSRITGAYYVRITAQGNTSTALSLIRTA